MITSKYFSEKEFQNCSPSCSLQNMKQEAMDKFDKAREKAGIPLVINCAYRSPEWDKKKGRSGNSAHTEGAALDIKCNTSETRLKIVRALLEVGCCRIGIGNGFVHADFSKKLPQNVIFTYY